MNPTILIVDDSLTIRMNLAEMLEAAGFVTLACASIGEARLLLHEHDISLMILDVVLPDGDGLDFLAEIRDAAESWDLIVMLLSSESDVADRIRGLKTGADDYVGKPYDPTYVIARATELLRHRRQDIPSARDTILLIDDSPTFLACMKQNLEEASYTVLTAASGEEGLRIAADRRPTAMVVDGQLPGIDGATVIRRIRLDAALRDLPCLLLTGSEDQISEVPAAQRQAAIGHSEHQQPDGAEKDPCRRRQ
jgi:two-component system NtrC family sensor kinase